MSAARVDLAIVGAGPAGMAAALAGRAHGLTVTVLDAQGAAGGQIYRDVAGAPASRIRLLGPDYQAGAELARRFAASGATHLRSATVWQLTRERRINYLQAGAGGELEAGAVVLCTGALERPMPVPGWTLPGVMTAGAAQILLKSADVVPAGPVVLAGNGPLLYLLADQYRRAGVRVAAMVDSTSLADWVRAAPRLPAALRDWRLLAKGMRLLRALRESGIPVHRGARGIAIDGPGEARRMRFHTAAGPQAVEAGLFLLHQGVVPDTQATRALGAAHTWNEAARCWQPATLSDGQLVGLERTYVAGDGARIMGAAAAEHSGRLAGLAAARALRGGAGGAALDADIEQARSQLRAAGAARPFLDALYRPGGAFRTPADEVVVCRCEEITAGTIRGHVRAGCLGPGQLKSFARCGMGPCQGRQCALTACEIIAAERGLPPAAIEPARVRFPLTPITLGEMGD